MGRTPNHRESDLLAALMPLANLLQSHHESLPDTRPVFAINDSQITVGDLRRAAAAVAKAKEAINAPLFPCPKCGSPVICVDVGPRPGMASFICGNAACDYEAFCT